jgi:hypothetical protein
MPPEIAKLFGWTKKLPGLESSEGLSSANNFICGFSGKLRDPT